MAEVSVPQAPEPRGQAPEFELAKILVTSGGESPVADIVSFIEADESRSELLIAALVNPSTSSSQREMLLEAITELGTRCRDLRPQLRACLELHKPVSDEEFPARVIQTIKAISNDIADADAFLISVFDSERDSRASWPILRDLASRANYSDRLVEEICKRARSRMSMVTRFYMNDQLLTSLMEKRPDDPLILEQAERRVEEYLNDEAQDRYFSFQRREIVGKVLEYTAQFPDREKVLPIYVRLLGADVKPELVQAICTQIEKDGVYAAELSQALVDLHRSAPRFRPAAVSALRSIYTNHGGEAVLCRLLLPRELAAKVPQDSAVTLADYPLEVLATLGRDGHRLAFDALKARVDGGVSRYDERRAIRIAAESEDLEIAAAAYRLHGKGYAADYFSERFLSATNRGRGQEELHMVLLASRLGDLVMSRDLVHRLCEIASRSDKPRYDWKSGRQVSDPKKLQVRLGEESEVKDVKRLALRALGHVNYWYNREVQKTLLQHVRCTRRGVSLSLLKSRQEASRARVDANGEDVIGAGLVTPVRVLGIHHWTKVSRKSLKRREAAIRAWGAIAAKNEYATQAAVKLLGNRSQLAREAAVRILGIAGIASVPYLDRMAKVISKSEKLHRSHVNQQNLGLDSLRMEEESLTRMRAAYFRVYESIAKEEPLIAVADVLRSTREQKFSVLRREAATRSLARNGAGESHPNDVDVIVRTLVRRGSHHPEYSAIEQAALVKLVSDNPELVKRVLSTRRDIVESRSTPNISDANTLSKGLAWIDAVVEAAGAEAREIRYHHLAQELKRA